MSKARPIPTQNKSPRTREVEAQAKIKRLRARLEEIAEYKRVLAVDGIKPDQDDKRVESELIVRLLYLEKELASMSPEALAAKARARDEAAKEDGGYTAKVADQERRAPAGDSRRPYNPAKKPSGDRRPYAAKADSDRRVPAGDPRRPYGPAKKPSGDRRTPAAAASGDRRRPSDAAKKPSGDRRPHGAKAGGDRRPFDPAKKPSANRRTPATQAGKGTPGARKPKRVSPYAAGKKKQRPKNRDA